MKYSRDRWLGYDQRFRQQAAANPGAIWAQTDPTLWNIAFEREGRGKLVQILLRIQPVSPLRLLLHYLSKIFPKETLTLSYKWNFKPEPVCLYPRCEYCHICSTVATMQGWLKSSALLTTPSPTTLENEYWAKLCLLPNVCKCWWAQYMYSRHSPQSTYMNEALVGMVQQRGAQHLIMHLQRGRAQNGACCLSVWDRFPIA